MSRLFTKRNHLGPIYLTPKEISTHKIIGSQMLMAQPPPHQKIYKYRFKNLKTYFYPLQNGNKATCMYSLRPEMIVLPLESFLSQNDCPRSIVYRFCWCGSFVTPQIVWQNFWHQQNHKHLNSDNHLGMEGVPINPNLNHIKTNAYYSSPLTYYSSLPLPIEAFPP